MIDEELVAKPAKIEDRTADLCWILSIWRTQYPRFGNRDKFLPTARANIWGVHIAYPHL